MTENLSFASSRLVGQKMFQILALAKDLENQGKDINLYKNEKYPYESISK